jgi:hypothetical protein
VKTHKIPAFAVSGLLLLLCLGCKSHSPSRVVASAVTGRVVDARTHQPIKDVQVHRQGPEDNHRSTQPLKGGQLMQQPPPVRTQADGTFNVPSIRALTLFHGAGFHTVGLTFTHPGYRRFSAVYTEAQATNAADSEPLINTGDVTLHPK